MDNKKCDKVYIINNIRTPSRIKNALIYIKRFRQCKVKDFGIKGTLDTIIEKIEYLKKLGSNQFSGKYINELKSIEKELHKIK